jgi:tripartite-type tricarboxylate transporter receptor subunit TctC
MLRIVWTLAYTAFATLASAQGYPQKPVRLVVPFAAGSATDTSARLLAQGLSERIKGAAFVVENRAGANGAVAAEYVAKAPPDGYTLMVATTSSHSQAPLLMKGITYDPIRDFTPVAGVGGVPFVIVVHPSLPVKTIREFVAFARARPKQLTYGTPSGTATICMETLRLKTGIDLTQVAYKSSPQALTELIAGQITTICSDFATAAVYIPSGRLRPLAMTTDQRSSALPDVPTVKETFPDFPEIRSWQGVVGPKGLPAEVVDLIGREVLAVTAQPDFKRRLAPLGFEILPLNAQQLAAYMVSEYAKWERLAKQAGIEPQ